MDTIPHSRPTLTPEAALSYCESGHTNAEAATYWGVSDRYIRKLKSQARGDMPSPTPDVSEPTPHYATVTSSAIARDGQMWKCPICGEMMAPLPGTTGAEWAEHGCYLHAAKPIIMSCEAEQPGGTEAESPVPEQTPEPELTAPCLVVPGGTADVPMPRPRVVRQRVVVRERVEVGVLAWVQEHPIWRNQVLAFLFVLGLIYVSRWG